MTALAADLERAVSTDHRARKSLRIRRSRCSLISTGRLKSTTQATENTLENNWDVLDEIEIVVILS